MSSSRSCMRCSEPLAADSVSEFCPTCMDPADTSKAPLITPPQFDSLFDGDTTSAQRSNFSSQTFDQVAAVDSKPNDSPRGNLPGSDFRKALPTSPPGFELIERLGGGGMGDVFLAREISTERLLAMKFLRSPGNPTAVERFLTEVRSLGRIRHPRIVAIHTTDFYCLVPFYTMDYVPGGTLSDRVANNGPMLPDEAARTVATCARAIAAAHAVGVLHRDLKPGNILLESDGTPRVADFGLAKLMDGEGSLTLTTSPLGTPGFMPPEQVSREHGEAGPFSDIYSLGATLYYLLVGRAPFVGKTSDEIIAQVLADSPSRIRAFRQDVPLGLEAIALKCLQKNPAERYSSVIALAEDLEYFLSGGEPEAPQMTRPRRVRRWLSSRRKRIAGALVILLAVFLGAVVLSADSATVDPSLRIAEELKAGRSVTLIGSSGPPTYSAWRLGGSPFGVSTSGEKVCYYESIDYSLLELVKDPGVDSYRVSFEMRHLEPKLAANIVNPEGRDRTFVAPYWGHCETVTAHGAVVHSMFAACFSDGYRNAIKPADPAKGVPEQAVNYLRLRSVGMLLSGDTGPTLLQDQIGPPLEFIGAKKPPGIWRRLELEVSPDGFRIGWEDELTGKLIFAKKLSGPDAISRYAGIQDRVNKQIPDSNMPLPQWSPRMPIGIWTYRSAVALRNVEIAPMGNSK